MGLHISTFRFQICLLRSVATCVFGVLRRVRGYDSKGLLTGHSMPFLILKLAIQRVLSKWTTGFVAVTRPVVKTNSRSTYASSLV